jgi:hypothetical protein
LCHLPLCIIPSRIALHNISTHMSRFHRAIQIEYKFMHTSKFALQCVSCVSTSICHNVINTLLVYMFIVVELTFMHHVMPSRIMSSSIASVSITFVNVSFSITRYVCVCIISCCIQCHVVKYSVSHRRWSECWLPTKVCSSIIVSFTSVHHTISYSIT